MLSSTLSLYAATIDSSARDAHLGGGRKNMDLDELFARRPDDPLVALLKQDIDRHSIDELEERVEALKSEIARCEAKISAASNHRNAADALFRRG
jgi:uncharacterized small protein (DUF1192 family)